MKILLLIFLTSCTKKVVYEVTYKTDGGRWKTFQSKPMEVNPFEYCQHKGRDLLGLLKIGHKETIVDSENCYEL